MKQYIEYIKKTVSWLNQLAKDEDLPLWWVYFDYTSAVIWHRCLIRQYVIGEFWKLSTPERKRRLTYSRMVKLFDRYNQKEYIHLLNEKSDFNAFFTDFVKRKWIHIEQVSEDVFVNFVKTLNVVIIKPFAGVEGGGYTQARIFSKSRH